MKRYSTSIDFKFWTLKEATVKVGFLVVSIFISFSMISAHAAEEKNVRFTGSERNIIISVIDQFKRECSHISTLDESKLKEIQNYYQTHKDSMPEEYKACYGEYLSQLAGTHNIHVQTCEEVTPKKNYGKDKDLARIFINARKYQYGIKTYHEKLNDCLIRKGAPTNETIPYSDVDKNGRMLSKKIREIDLSPPFKENSVHYR